MIEFHIDEDVRNADWPKHMPPRDDATVEAKHGNPGDPGYQLLHPGSKIPDRPGKPTGAMARGIAGMATPDDPDGPHRPHPAGMEKIADGDVERLKATGVKVKPGLKDVSVATNPKASLQAIGYDAGGKPQYIYSAKWNANQAVAKFARARAFAKLAPKVDAALERDYRKPEVGPLVLIRKLGLRPDSGADNETEVKAFGATSLKAGDVTVHDDSVDIDFVGKHAVPIHLTSTDPLVIRTMRSHKRGKHPDEPLFDNGGNVKTAYDKTTRYFKKLAPGFKLKDLRTYYGSGYAKSIVKSMDTPTSEKAMKKAMMEVATKVSEVLGNTPKVAFDSYVDPGVFGKWRRALANA